MAAASRHLAPRRTEKTQPTMDEVDLSTRFPRACCATHGRWVRAVRIGSCIAQLQPRAERSARMDQRILRRKQGPGATTGAVGHASETSNGCRMTARQSCAGQRPSDRLMDRQRISERAVQHAAQQDVPQSDIRP